MCKCMIVIFFTVAWIIFYCLPIKGLSDVAQFYNCIYKCFFKSVTDTFFFFFLQSCTKTQFNKLKRERAQHLHTCPSIQFKTERDMTTATQSTMRVEICGPLCEFTNNLIALKQSYYRWSICFTYLNNIFCLINS